MNAAERLCRALHGRELRLDDTIGGNDARLLHDAAELLETLVAAKVWRPGNQVRHLPEGWSAGELLRVVEGAYENQATHLPDGWDG